MCLCICSCSCLCFCVGAWWILHKIYCLPYPSPDFALCLFSLLLIDFPYSTSETKKIVRRVYFVRFRSPICHSFEIEHKLWFDWRRKNGGKIEANLSLNALPNFPDSFSKRNDFFPQHLVCVLLMGWDLLMLFLFVFSLEKLHFLRSKSNA